MRPKVFCVGGGIVARLSTLSVVYRERRRFRVFRNVEALIGRVAEAEAVAHEMHVRIENALVVGIP